MEVVLRGIRNVFRNALRSGAVALILTVVISFGLVMLISLKAVEQKVQSVQQSIGTTITVMPAGARGFQGGGEPITTAEIAKVQAIAHVSSTASSLDDRVQTGTDTNLQSAIDPGTLGQRNGRRDAQVGGGGVAIAGPGGTQFNPATFKLPISITGTDTPDSAAVQGVSSVSLTSGSYFAGNSTDDVAIVGKDLATKNSLSVGSTFTLYNTTFTVKGIEDTGSTFSNSGIVIPLQTLQTLSNQAGDATALYVNADSLSNLSQVQSDITNTLGSSTVDVTSQIDEANQALKPLQNIQTITLYSLIGALVAGTIIILLTMLMIVRERRKEVGVLKAIGASNSIISTQFLVESLTLSLVAAVVGTIAGAFLSNPVLNSLLNSSTTTTTSGAVTTGGRGGFAGAVFRIGGQANAAFGNVKNIHAIVSWSILGYGLLIAIGIALIGTLLPTLFIARIRPAEVLRGE